MENTKQKIVFSLPTKQKIEFKIRLHRDSITQSMFFNAIVTAYVESVGDFMTWYAQARGNMNSNKTRQKILKKEERVAADNIKKFGLNKNEIDDIYDLIVKEEGEQM